MIQTTALAAPASKDDSMEVDTLMKGMVTVTPDQVVTFVEPLIGFDHLKSFVFLQTQEGPLCWLQSTEDREAAFCVLSVFNTSLDPDIAVGPQDLTDIEATTVEDVTVYTLVVLDEDPDKIRTNLRAPILVCAKSGKAKQVVMNDPELPVQFYLRELLTRPHD